MLECLKERIILYRSVRRFSEAKARIHAGPVRKNSVYAGWSRRRSVCTQVSGYWSSVHLLSWVLAAFVYCCSVLGLEFGVWVQLSEKCLLNSVLIGEKEIVWCRNSWWLSDVHGSILKIYETWSLEEREGWSLLQVAACVLVPMLVQELKGVVAPFQEKLENERGL